MPSTSWRLMPAVAGAEGERLHVAVRLSPRRRKRRRTLAIRITRSKVSRQRCMIR
jgi:hypothetical protein